MVARMPPAKEMITWNWAPASKYRSGCRDLKSKGATQRFLESRI